MTRGLDGILALTLRLVGVMDGIREVHLLTHFMDLSTILSLTLSGGVLGLVTAIVLLRISVHFISETDGHVHTSLTITGLHMATIMEFEMEMV